MSSVALSEMSDDYEFRLHSTSYFSPTASHQHVDLAAHSELGQVHTRFDGKAAIRENPPFVMHFEIVHVGAVGMDLGADGVPGAVNKVLPVSGFGDALTDRVIYLPA